MFNFELMSFINPGVPAAPASNVNSVCVILVCITEILYLLVVNSAHRTFLVAYLLLFWLNGTNSMQEVALDIQISTHHWISAMSAAEITVKSFI